MAQELERLPSKCKVLSSNPSIEKIKHFMLSLPRQPLNLCPPTSVSQVPGY
jgi:hypothetical protein